MSDMKFLRKLPDGISVEQKSLESISIKISSGGTPKTSVKSFYDGDIPWLRTQEVNFGDIWNTGVKITKEGLKNSSARYIPENSVIVAMYGATVGKIGINKIPMTTNQACANIQLDPNVANYRFIFHFLCKQYEYIKSLGSGSQTNINAGIVKKLQIPIPCPANPKKSLAIQAEIVRILDAFTELTTELTTELAMRNKQYNHYRSQLLDFKGTFSRAGGFLDRLLGGEQVEWKLLKNLTVPTKNIKWNGSRGSYQYIDLTSVDIKTKAIIDTKRITSDSAPSRAQKLVETDDLLFATTRPAQQRYCLIDESLSGQVASTGYCVLRAKRSEVLPKWILYWISTTDFKSYVEDNQSGAAYPAISDTKVKEFNIPIPCPNDPEKSLTIQAEIVRILDKFNTLTTSLSEGLPHEIKLREQQYEYYRDLLLSFPKPEEGA